MIHKRLTLAKKEKLTHDVFELIFTSEQEVSYKPGQFITFILPSWLKRAYSISSSDGKVFEFIIKRLPDWTCWRKELCDLEVWSELGYTWPSWLFNLNEKDNAKLFLWTWTWSAPLLSQIRRCLENSYKSKIQFVFWVRYKKDFFYLDMLKYLKDNYVNFSYRLYLSREDDFIATKWYIAEYLTTSTINEFDEFYVCWSPEVVRDVRTRLIDFWVPKEIIFFEQF